MDDTLQKNQNGQQPNMPENNQGNSDSGNPDDQSRGQKGGRVGYTTEDEPEEADRLQDREKINEPSRM